MDMSFVVNTNKKPVFIRNCYGMTNLFPDGNFASSTGWLSLYGTVAVEENALKVTYDGTNKQFSAYKNTDIAMSDLYGKKIAVRVKMKVTGSVKPAGLGIKLRGVTAGSATYQYNLANCETDTIYNVSTIANMSNAYGSGKLRIYFEAQYNSGANISDCCLECTELMIIDLTSGFGVGNEPSADQLNYIVDHQLSASWFSGSVQFDTSPNGQQVSRLAEEIESLNEKLDGIVTERLDGISSALPNKYALVEIPKRIVLACWRRIILAYDYTKYEVSFDAGETWQNCSGVPTQSDVPIALVFRSGKAVIFLTSAYYYSDDAINFTEVSYSSVGIQAAPYYVGVSLMKANEIDTAIFGEYTSSFTGHCNLWKTTDGGHTWTKLFDITKAIRHVHTVTYLRHKTYGGILVTSGDQDSEVQWWFSHDWGTTWDNIVDGTSADVLNPQDYRSLGQVFDEDGNVYWCVDNDYNDTTAVYKAHITTPLEKTKLLDVCGVGYGLKNIGGVLLLLAVPSANVQPVTTSNVYCSMDGGTTWNIILMDKGITDSMRLYRIIGPDAFGRFYLPHGAMELGNYVQGTYRIEIKGKVWTS